MIFNKRPISAITLTLRENPIGLPVIGFVPRVNDDVICDCNDTRIDSLVAHCRPLAKRADIDAILSTEDFVEYDNAVGEFLIVKWIAMVPEGASKSRSNSRRAYMIPSQIACSMLSS